MSRCAQWMRSHLDDDRRWHAYILDHGGEAVGSVWLQLVEKIPNPLVEPEAHAYVTNFFVRPEHRNGGAGSALLTAVLDDCAALNVDVVFLWPTPRSRALYERFGFSPQNSVMVLERG